MTRPIITEEDRVLRKITDFLYDTITILKKDGQLDEEDLVWWCEFYAQALLKNFNIEIKQ